MKNWKNWLASFCVLFSTPVMSEDASFSSNWHDMFDGTFIGADIWSNPVQDWRIHGGKLQCHVSGGNRNIYLLTHELSREASPFSMEVVVKSLMDTDNAEGYVGFRIGVKGDYGDYRDAAIHGRGIKAGVSSKGVLFIGDVEGDTVAFKGEAVRLEISVDGSGGSYSLTLRAWDADNLLVGTVSRSDLSGEAIAGGVGLVCHSGNMEERETVKGRGNVQRAGKVKASFANWSLSGGAVEAHADRTFGPIAFSLYTLDRGILKMTAQMMPVSSEAEYQVELELKSGTDWQVVQSSTMVEDSRTAHFRVENWRSDKAVPFRVSYRMKSRSGKTSQHYYEGVISAEPKAGAQLKVASLSCHLDLGFPHQHMVGYVMNHKPDMVLFTGDQYYEGNAGYGAQRAPTGPATLDYLRKWYQFGWAFRDTFRSVPSVFLIDDHDVYHGNIWGAQGKAAVGENNTALQDSGGYKMPASWVNAVQRSQTSHMPASPNSTPVKQDIGVYYTDIKYGGVSFAVLEDRKWKSAPRGLLPQAKIVNGFSKNPLWDAATDGDIEGATLLGVRQLDFLENWSKDWSDDVRMKTVVSQTLFSSVQTRPRADIEQGRDRGMRPVPPGEYPLDDITVQDFDTNGWPQTPRKHALLKLRKSFAFHVAGDTHLGATFQYGIDGWDNASWAIGSPAISNVWPRRWFPEKKPLDYKAGNPRNLGQYYDGFGNEITVHAVANPTNLEVEPVHINERAPGYNILVFDTAKQTLRVEAWPRWVDPGEAGAQMFEGWPITLKQTDNGYPHNGPALPVLKNLATDQPVVQLVNEETDEVIYTVRLSGNTIQPRAFVAGVYIVRIFDRNMSLLHEFENQRADTGSQ